MTDSAGLVVLGMHRSGTSAVMGALQAMGLHVGDKASLTAPNWDNPKGFFERKDARRCCDALLHGAGADWWKLADFSIDQIPGPVRAEQVEALHGVLERLQEGGFWALKEPRLCVLFPLLRPLLPARPLVLFVVRHPVAVALSLQKRQGYSLQAGAALWERYNRDAVRHMAGARVFRLVFEEVVARPREALSRLADELRQAVPGLQLDPAAGAALIDAGSRHHVTHPELEALLTDEQQALWRALSTAAPVPAWTEAGQARNRLQLQDLERVHAALQGQAERERDAHRATRAAHKDIRRLEKRLARLEKD